MKPLTEREIERGIARRQLPSGSWIAYEICGDCHSAFEMGQSKLGYGFTNEVKDRQGRQVHPNGHPADGRGRCRTCLEKRGVFEPRKYQQPNLRERVLAGIVREGSTVAQLTRELKTDRTAVDQCLRQLCQEGRVSLVSGLYRKIHVEQADEEAAS